MPKDLGNILDSSIINNKPDLQQRKVEIIESEIKRLISAPPSEEDVIKKDFLIDLYGNIVNEYDKILNVLRKRAKADKNTIMNLDSQTPEVIEAGRKIFGDEVKAITYDRYIDMLRLERDLNAICAKEAIDGDIL